jgi:hypothetical protein
MPLSIPDYQRGFRLRGVIAVCPGHFATGVGFSFYKTMTIEGTECQMEPVMKARDAREANRILCDFRHVLSQKEITLGRMRNPLTIGEDEQNVYALTTDFATPCDATYINNGGSVVNFYLWKYEHGTQVTIDLTPEEIKMVNDFFDKHLGTYNGVGSLLFRVPRSGHDT